MGKIIGGLLITGGFVGTLTIGFIVGAAATSLKMTDETTRKAVKDIWDRYVEKSNTNVDNKEEELGI